MFTAVVVVGVLASLMGLLVVGMGAAEEQIRGCSAVPGSTGGSVRAHDRVPGGYWCDYHTGTGARFTAGPFYGPARAMVRLILFIVALAALAWFDMRRRVGRGLRYGLLVLAAPPLGVLVWAYLRPWGGSPRSRRWALWCRRVWARVWARLSAYESTRPG